jgi:hypothetical protein
MRAVFRQCARKLMVLTVPDIAINDGPGYREFYGETTKHALEPSVFNLLNALVATGWGLGVMRFDSVGQ